MDFLVAFQQGSIRKPSLLSALLGPLRHQLSLRPVHKRIIRDGRNKSWGALNFDLSLVELEVDVEVDLEVDFEGAFGVGFEIEFEVDF